MHAGKNSAGRDHTAEHAEHGGQRRAGEPGRHRDAGGRKAVPARETLAAGILGEKRRKAERLIRPRAVDGFAQHTARHKDDGRHQHLAGQKRAALPEQPAKQPGVQNVHRRHRPGARDAQRPPRRRPRPEPAEHCVVLFGLHPSAPSLLFISAYHPLPGLSNQGRGRYNRAWNLELSVETVAALCAPQAGERVRPPLQTFMAFLVSNGYGAQSAATFSMILETSS